MRGQSYTNSKIILRENAIRTTLARVGGSFRDDQIQFRDADQIALWVNTHPPVAAWLLEQTQPGLVGVFRDWSHWSGRYDLFRWIPDKRLEDMTSKLLPPFLRLAALRGCLDGQGMASPALFTKRSVQRRTRKKQKGRHASATCLFTLWKPRSAPSRSKEHRAKLADAGIRAIVVVDRCAQDTHQDLTAIVKRANSRLSLITIDDEVPSTERPAPDIVVVIRADESVIDQMLKQDQPRFADRRSPASCEIFPRFPADRGFAGPIVVESLRSRLPPTPSCLNALFSEGNQVMNRCCATSACCSARLDCSVQNSL